MKFARSRDVPDVLGFADYAADPTTTYRLLHERASSGQMFHDVRLFPLLKGEGPRVRSLTTMHPLDEFALRSIVGRCSQAIRSAIDSNEVLNGVIHAPGPGWFSADFRDQARRRRELQRELYERESTGAVAFYDVENFFPSCAHEVLHDLLVKAGSPVGAAAVLVRMLGGVFSSGCGLPIGFEGSGPLANLFLAPVDRELRSRLLPFVRWTDDTDVFLRSVDQFATLTEMIEARLAAVGLRLNYSKVAVHEKGEVAEARLLDPSRDSVFGEDAEAAIADRLDAAVFLQDLGCDEQPPPAHLRSWLGLLKTKRSSAAVPFICRNPQWVDREPKVVGDYMATLAENPATRAELDLDWMLDQAIGRKPTKETAAGQLHMLRALTSAKLDKERGKRVLEFATDYPTVTSLTPLGAWGIRAWSASQAWRPNQSQDLIKTFAAVEYRRAAASGFVDHGSARHSTALAAIADRVPELQPVASMT